MADTKPVDQPFKVMTDGGVFLDGFADMAGAEARAARANADAADLGLSVTYSASEGARSADANFGG